MHKIVLIERQGYAITQNVTHHLHVLVYCGKQCTAPGRIVTNYEITSMNQVEECRTKNQKINKCMITTPWRMAQQQKVC